MRSLLAGIAFLTRLPIGRWIEFDAADVARSAGWFPVIGALVGSICAAAAALLRGHLPNLVIAVLIVALNAALTGALHFDGLADTADGFGGGHDREHVLRIMRDHAIGSYGATALVLSVALQVAVYDALLAGVDWPYFIALVPALGRWSITLLTGALPYARPTASVAGSMGKTAAFQATCAMALLAAAARRPAVWAAAIGVLAVTCVFGFYCRRRIGGITGDTLGANVQLSECAALLAFVWRLS